MQRLRVTDVLRPAVVRLNPKQNDLARSDKRRIEQPFPVAMPTEEEEPITRVEALFKSCQLGKKVGEGLWHPLSCLRVDTRTGTHRGKVFHAILCYIVTEGLLSGGSNGQAIPKWVLHPAATDSRS